MDIANSLALVEDPGVVKETARRLAHACVHNPNRYLAAVSPQTYEAVTAAAVAEALRDADCTYAVATKGQPVGFLLAGVSAWDSELFRFPVARISSVTVDDGLPYEEGRTAYLTLFARLNDWFREKQIRFAFVRVPADDIRLVNALIQSDYMYIETYAEYFLDLEKRARWYEGSAVARYAKNEEIPLIREYSRNTFLTQRFHTDPHVKLEDAEKLYQKWIETRTRTDRILVCEQDGVPLTFMIYTIRTLAAETGPVNIAGWNFLVQKPGARGRGLGYEAIKAIIRFHAETERCRFIRSGVSFRNIVSVNLHNKVGFSMPMTAVTFHLWR